jgi:hypothetical protein
MRFVSTAVAAFSVLRAQATRREIDNGHRNNLSNTCFIAAGCLSSLYSQSLQVESTCQCVEMESSPSHAKAIDVPNQTGSGIFCDWGTMILRQTLQAQKTPDPLRPHHQEQLDDSAQTRL